MPLVSSDYNPPLPFKNGHFSTIYAGLLRKVTGVAQKRERLNLPDGDFLDLDWSFSTPPTQKIVILLHGLEGSAQRPYILGSAKLFNNSGFDACAVNFRSCSGETNRLFRSYHSGATEDLEAVIQHILNTRNYSYVIIKGFSLGGNLALKYMGEGREIPTAIKAVIGISVPCNLHDSLLQLLKAKNIPYSKRFKSHLVKKLIQKQLHFPDSISDEIIKSIKTLKDFDDLYTSRAHGFKDAIDYYNQCSCLQFLPYISVPVHILNAKNDSFLGAHCYPFKEAEVNTNIYLETPKYGGHVGFWGSSNITYSEKRAIKFLEEVL